MGVAFGAGYTLMLLSCLDQNQNLVDIIFTKDVKLSKICLVGPVKVVGWWVWVVIVKD